MLLDNQIAGFFRMYYPKEEMDNKVYFWHPDRQAGTTSLWVCIAIHNQSTQNKKFAYLSKSYRAYLILSYEQKRFLQVDSIFLGVHG